MKINNINDLIGRMQNYDNENELKGAFDGHLTKSVVRIDDDTNEYKNFAGQNVKKTAKDSLFFSGLFRALISKKSHYKTYLNDLFEGKNKSDMHIPSNVSCFVKYSQNNSDCQIEVIGSRLANLFGVDTVYNLAIESDKQDEYAEYPKYDAILSVDCVPAGYTMETFERLYLDFTDDDMLDDILYRLDSDLLCIARENHSEISSKGIEKIKKDFAIQYVFRNLVCEDYDFCDKNTALLIGGCDMHLAPCFDMELLFRGKKSHSYYKKVASNTIDCMMETMPDVLEDFMNRYKKIVEGKELENVVMNSVKVDPRYVKPIYEQIVTNYERLRDLVAEHQASQEM